jgi:hypothetical protein
VAHTRTYSTAKSWIAAGEHVHVDNEISGAEFVAGQAFCGSWMH